ERRGLSSCPGQRSVTSRTGQTTNRRPTPMATDGDARERRTENVVAADPMGSAAIPDCPYSWVHPVCSGWFGWGLPLQYDEPACRTQPKFWLLPYVMDLPPLDILYEDNHCLAVCK